MSSRSWYNRDHKRISVAIFVTVFVGCMVQPRHVAASEAPPWMHAVVTTSIAPQDEKIDAVLLYSEQIVNVQSADKIRTVTRAAYKILRPSGREHGYVAVYFNSHRKITGMRGWCIPANGKDYEVKDKDAVMVSLPKIEGSDLISDVKDKVIQIPAADPGSIIGYEYETEEQPYVLQDVWFFQQSVPVREARFTLQLPPGWEYKSTWMNATEVKPVQSGTQWQWTVSGVPALRREQDMPPMRRVAGHMIVSFYPAAGSAPGKTFSDWRQMGSWYNELTSGRSDASPEIKQKVVALTSSATTPLEKIRAIARFLQSDIRYVAIELGIGGWQPHPAPEIFTHRYGDCKDKATLMRVMLHEAGIESYYLPINIQRGAVMPEMQAHVGAFNHVIVAIKLPDGINDSSLDAIIDHQKLGRLLFFDPTNELTPLGQIGGYLQSNYGLVVTPAGGELLELPRQAASTNGVERIGQLTLGANGALEGEIGETRRGDRAAEQRESLRRATNNVDKIKPIESLLAHSLSTFHLTKASVSNVHETAEPFGYKYSFICPDYAKNAGNLLLVRPRVIGQKSSGLLETKEPRRFPVEFEGLTRDSDTFEITFPAGYEVEDLPPPVNADYSFATYRSKTEVRGNVLRYSRTFEIRELSVPLNKVEDLKQLYRIISADERNNAVLRPRN